jgi:hypothetical protein
MLERREAGDDPAVDAKRRDLVRDDLFGVRDDLEDRAPQRLERAALGLLDALEVLVNIFGGQVPTSLESSFSMGGVARLRCAKAAGGGR